MAGKRYSRQRELIYQCLLATRRHPTAEMVYDWLKPENPNLSLGTVYRNLKLLSQEGVITCMPFPVERYDANTCAHPHFQCRCCGEVTDLAGEYDTQLDARCAADTGHQVERHELVFHGVCADCLAQQETPPDQVAIFEKKE